MQIRNKLASLTQSRSTRFEEHQKAQKWKRLGKDIESAIYKRMAEDKGLAPKKQTLRRVKKSHNLVGMG